MTQHLRPLLGVLFLLVSVAGCRSLERPRLALLELGALPPEERELPRFEQLAGANPAVAFLWLQTIYVDPRRTSLSAQQARDNARRALRFLPADANLRIAEADMVHRSAGPAAAAEVLRAALGGLNEASAEFALRARLTEMLLQADAVTEAEEEVLRLAGSQVASPPMVAALWAGLALGHEFLGDRSAADRCLDLSVRWHPSGLERLSALTAGRPELTAAARGLRRRAVERHPWNPDARVLATGDLLNRDEVDAAAQLLEGLDEELPLRLHGPRAVLRARALSLRGDPAAAAELLLEHLRRWRSDLLALEALLLTYEVHREPDVALVLDRIAAALTSSAAAAWAPPVLDRLHEIAEQLQTSAPPGSDAPASVEG